MAERASYICCDFAGFEFGSRVIHLGLGQRRVNRGAEAVFCGRICSPFRLRKPGLGQWFSL